ncbi:hypothetical protein ASZ78_004095, partial [Callipepla squamata]
NRLLPTELRHQALALQKELQFEMPGEDGVTGSQDDEYRWAGLDAPKVMVTTSREPSARLRVFAKELCLVIPGARRLNRGRAEVGALVSACRAAGVTDLLVLHETRGQPGEMGWGHGKEVGTILKHLFPVPRPQTHRVVTFANEDDVILVRNHVYRRQGKTVELEEVGPRFQLRPYLIRLGTLEQGDTADVEWRWHPYTTTASKRHLLSAS